MIYVIQILSFLFAFACAVHDCPAIDNFTFYGSDEKQQKRFHLFNGLLKSCFVGAVFICGGWMTATLSALIIYMVFDPVVAIFRTVFTPPKKPWYYLSTKGIDGFLVKALGQKAGLYKAAFCLVLIIALNIIYYGNA